MRSIKIYSAVYTGFYKALVFVIAPFLTIAASVLLSFYNAGKGFEGPEMFLWPIGFIAMDSEYLGEMVSIGNICAKKGSFGDIMMSSPRGREAIRGFAVADTVRKLIQYPLICLVSQIFVSFIAPEYTNLPGALVIGLITSASVLFGMWLYRKTNLVMTGALVFFLMGLIWFTLAGIYTFSDMTAVKAADAAVTVLLATGACFLSAGSIIRHSEGDYYDKGH